MNIQYYCITLYEYCYTVVHSYLGSIQKLLEIIGRLGSVCHVAGQLHFVIGGFFQVFFLC